MRYVANAHKIIFAAFPKSIFRRGGSHEGYGAPDGTNTSSYWISFQALQLWRHLQIQVVCYDDRDGDDFMRQPADFVG